MKEVNFDDYANNYNEICKNQHDFFTSDETYFARNKVNIIKRNQKKDPINILEFGCGIGSNIKFLRQAFPNSNLYGCDVSDKSLEVARKNNHDILFFNNENESVAILFDLILVACVFHHIKPQYLEDTILKIMGLMTKNGSIFIFEHNPCNPITQYIVRTCPFDKNASLIKRMNLVKLLRAAGLEIVSSKYTLFFPPSINENFLNRLEHFLGCLPLGGQYYIHARQPDFLFKNVKTSTDSY